MFQGDRNPTAIDKALDVCEALGRSPRGIALSELARAVGQPAPTLHRTLAVLKRRGYVRQDEETQRYGLTLKMLDLTFQLLGGSELRLHAYPVLREHVMRSRSRTFLAVPAHDEVTYVWAAGPGDVAMRTVYGREMPAHCALYFSTATQGTRRLSCLKLPSGPAASAPFGRVERLGSVEPCGPHRLCCTCAPVHDYTGREVARVGLFAHQSDDAALGTDFQQVCRELARRISVRLGHLPAAYISVTA
jgi:DNA-binding IclR family transcriptional regulator